MPIIFAAISPHAPIFLPTVGSEEDRKKIKKTIDSLGIFAEKFKKTGAESIIISSPHQDWGIKVPWHFLSSKVKIQNPKLQFKIQNYQAPSEKMINWPEELTVYPIITTLDSPQQHFEWGKEFYTRYKMQNTKYKIALIASGDLSHCLKEDGPYGFHPDGPKFDEELIKYLKRKDVETILKLEEDYPNAGECGLRSFCFMLGILESSGIDYKPEILSYEGPFGVGYLTVNFKLK